MRAASLWPGFPFCHLAGIDGTSNRLRWSVLRRPRRRVCDRRFSFPFESFQPDSTKSRVENLPSTFNYGWDTLCARAPRLEKSVQKRTHLNLTFMSRSSSCSCIRKRVRPYRFSNLSKNERQRCRASRRSSVDTLSPRSLCFSKPDRSLAKPSASHCQRNIEMTDPGDAGHPTSPSTRPDFSPALHVRDPPALPLRCRERHAHPCGIRNHCVGGLAERAAR